MICLFVEGNIGAGKSTFIKDFIANYKQLFLDQYGYNLVAYPENVSDWVGLENVDGINMFEQFNKDQSNSFEFQMVVQSSRLKNELSCFFPKTIVVFERSLKSGNFVFGQNLFQSNLLSKSQYEFLNKHFTSQIEQDGFFVFLNVDVETCIKRMKFRNREGEEAISIDYLKSIDKLYRRQEFDLICNDPINFVQVFDFVVEQIVGKNSK